MLGLLFMAHILFFELFGLFFVTCALILALPLPTFQAPLANGFPNLGADVYKKIIESLKWSEETNQNPETVMILILLYHSEDNHCPGDVKCC